MNIYRVSCICALYLVANILNAVDTEKLDDEKFLLPAPIKFYRLDGKNTKFDDVIKGLTDADARLIAFYGTESDLADLLSNTKPSIKRYFLCADLSPANRRKIRYTEDDFQGFKRRTISKITESEAPFKATIDELNATGSDKYSKLVGRDVKYSLNHMIPLGLFDETKEYMCFSILAQDRLNSSESVTVSSLAFLLHKGVICSIYAYSNYRDKSDIEWTRNALKAWRDDIVKVNMENH